MKIILCSTLPLLFACNVVKTSSEAKAEEVESSQSDGSNDTGSNGLNDTNDVEDNNQNNQSGLVIEYKRLDCVIFETEYGYRIGGVDPDTLSVWENEYRENGYLVGVHWFEENSDGDRCDIDRNGEYFSEGNPMIDTLEDGFVVGYAVYPYIKPL